MQFCAVLQAFLGQTLLLSLPAIHSPAASSYKEMPKQERKLWVMSLSVRLYALDEGQARLSGSRKEQSKHF